MCQCWGRCGGRCSGDLRAVFNPRGTAAPADRLDGAARRLAARRPQGQVRSSGQSGGGPRGAAAVRVVGEVWDGVARR